MFSNTLALDVVIGLILIYFIYSLLITIIGEILSSWMGIRARLLRQGIGSLLNDHRPGNNQVDFLRYLKDIFLVEPAVFKFSTAGRFYKEPGIRKLAKRGDEKAWYSIRNTKPSYFSKELYASTLITMFGRKGRGVCERDRVFSGVETNSTHFEPETYKRFKEMLDASNGELPLFQTHLEEEFSEMMDRLTGWYKRKMDFILFWLGFLICICLNIDTFQIVHILVKNPESRQAMIKLAQEAVKDQNSGTAWTQVSPDSSTYTALLEDSYARAFRDAREIEFLMAMGWDFKGEPEEIKVDKNKISDVKNILKVSKISQIKKLKNEIDTSDFTAPELKNKIADYYHLVQYQHAKVLSPLRAILEKRIASIDLDSTSLKGDTPKEAAKTSVLKNIMPFLYKTNSYTLNAAVEPSLLNKIMIVLGNTLPPWKPKFWGIALSALALSLGSNFWFDLLKRLVSIRSAGVKPGEKVNSSNTVNSVNSLKTSGLFIDNLDPVIKAISDYGKYWESILGVVAVNKAAIKKSDGTKAEGIEIIIDPDSFISDRIQDSLQVVMGTTSHTVLINKLKGKKGILTNGLNFAEGDIYHSGTNQKGSPAGIVHNKRTGRDALLTCSHVVQNSNDPFIDPFKATTQLVVNVKGVLEGQPFGRVANLNISSYMDVAIIDIEKPEILSLLKSTIFKLENIKAPSEVTDTHVQTSLKLVIHTPREMIKNLTLNSSGVDYTFDRGTTSEARFRNLIRFGDKASRYKNLPTKPGDSGSLITNESGDPVGILLGHALINKEFHIFGIKMKDIFEIMQIQPVKTKS